MYRDRTAAARKLEQLFWFGATSDFAMPFMKQSVPHRAGMSFLGCFREDLSFFSRFYILDVLACSLAPTNLSMAFLSRLSVFCDCLWFMLTV